MSRFTHNLPSRDDALCRAVEEAEMAILIEERTRNPTFDMGIDWGDDDEEVEIEVDDDPSLLEALPSTCKAGETSPAGSESSKLSADTSALIDELFGESEDEDPNAIDFQLSPIPQADQTNSEPQVQDQGPSRFAHVEDIEAEVSRRMKDRVPQKTKRNNNWAQNVWNEWREANPMNPPVRDIRSCTEGELGRALERFVLEVRRKDGEVYPPDSLYQLCCGINRVYNDRTDGFYREPVNIFDESSIHFFRLVLFRC